LREGRRQFGVKRAFARHGHHHIRSAGKSLRLLQDGGQQIGALLLDQPPGKQQA
jgi:hypothetical protein